MNKPYMHTSIIGISSFQNELKHPTFLREFFKTFGTVWAHFTPNFKEVSPKNTEFGKLVDCWKV